MPPTRYSDVLGQNAAVEAARDLIELPLKHADLFLRIGAKPSGHGIILAGPPGTGKTLLACAVAGECGAHIEIVNGPALLSKWVGETEAAIRDVFNSEPCSPGDNAASRGGSAPSEPVPERACGEATSSWQYGT